MGAQTQHGLLREIAQWQAKIQALESTQRETDDEHAKIIQKQRQGTEELQEQNAHLKLVLSVDKQAATAAQQDRIDKLHDLIETYTRKVEVESRQLESIQQELEVTQARIQDVQRIAGGPHIAAESARQAAKARQLLENRLEHAEKRFGEALTLNKVLRRDIDKFNKEKAAFQQLCARLDRDLSSICTELEMVMNSTMICEEAKTLAKQQLMALQLQSDKEVAAAQLEMEEMAACQEADKTLLQVQAKRMASAGESLDPSGHPPAPDTLDPSTCSDIINQLQNVTGITDLPALVAHLSQLEAVNFALFNECNQANERVGTMQKELKALQLEALQVEEASGNTQHKEVIKATQAKQEQAQKRAEILQAKKVVLERRLVLIRAGVGSALKSLGGKLMPAIRPEDTASVYAALLQNLGQLEARSRAVLAVHSTLAGRNTADTRAMLTAHLSSSQQHRAAEVEPHPSRPTSGNQGEQASNVPAPTRSLSTIMSKQSQPEDSDDSGSDDDDEDAVPLTRAQLQAKLGY